MYRRYFVDNLPKTTHRPFVRLSKTALRTGHWRQRSVLLCLISSQHIWYFAYRQHTKNRRRRVNVILECRAQQMIASLNKAIINIRSRLAAALWWVGLAYAVFPSPMPGHCVHWKCDVGTKPETHNILQCGQRRTEPRPLATCVENSMKFGRVFLDTQSHRHTRQMQTRWSQYFALLLGGETNMCCLGSRRVSYARLDSDLRIVMSMFVCVFVNLSVCLWAYLQIGSTIPIFTKLLCMLLVAVARSSSGGIVIRYALPVFGGRHISTQWVLWRRRRK